MTTQVKRSMPSELNNVTEWIDDMRKWPNIMYGDIFNYLISSKAVDGAEMKNFKSLQSYNYFQSGNVDKVLHNIISDARMYLKADVRASQTVSRVNEAYVICSMDGTVEQGWCTCMAGQGLSCSHVGAVIWKVERAVRNNMTGASCTDENAMWNRGTKRNIEPRPLSNIVFKKPKQGENLLEDLNVNAPGVRDTPMYYSSQELRTAVEPSPLLPLFKIKGTTINKSFVSKPAAKENIPKDHGEHDSLSSCQRCASFYSKYLAVDLARTVKLQTDTINQSKSVLWKDTRKIRITASSASKVPIKETTDCTNFIREHLHPKFIGNKFTKHGQEGETAAKGYLLTNGHRVIEKGTYVSSERNWLSASPDGILNDDTLLEIKCTVPSAKWTTLNELFTGQKYDVQMNNNGILVLKVKGNRGFFLQIQLTMFCTELRKCKLLIWLNPDEFQFIEVPYDEQYVCEHVARLRTFYFKKMMNIIVDEIEDDRLVFSKAFIKFMRL
ncbi:uncharacterized protein [Mytilus edulis]|uniref:uncharacterized protein n=1 Tax=Mytilus edulis TaxID=6550 RepID=UPI0039F08D65